MELARRILKHKKVILFIFVFAAIVCAVIQNLVSVNYDMMHYLPDHAPSTIALNAMNKEYTVAAPNARVMIPNVSVPQTLSYKERLSKVRGVKEVNWLDDATEVNVPLETIPQETLDAWYKDNTALMTLTIDKNYKDTAVKEIRSIIGDQASMSGEIVNLQAAMQSASAEIPRMMFILVPIVLAILLLTTTSWFEPILFLVSIFAAIILNSGTNAFLGEISFVSKAAGSVLQLAVSLDYSIFLLHRFAEFRREGQNVESAMVNAMVKSFSSIMASGLTTVIGFAALIFMQFKIGPDLGIIMAKAIVFSMLTVLVFLPALAVVSYRLIDKTHHRPLIPPFKKFGQFVGKTGMVFLIVLMLMIVPSNIAQGKNSFVYGASGIFGDESTQVGRENASINRLFGKSNNMVLMVPKGRLALEKTLYNKINDTDGVSSIISYVGNIGAQIPMEYVPGDKLSKLISENYSRMIITLDCDAYGDEAFALVEKMRGLAQGSYPDTYYLTGESVNAYDMKDTVTKDNIVVNTIAIGSIFLILLLSFRSITLPVILLLVIETSIWINLSIPYFGNSSIFFMAYLIISSVQLGSTVDYAILFTNRYAENRGLYKHRDAIKQTIADTAVSILTSAFVLCSGGAIMGLISTNAVLKQLGILIGRGALISAACVLFVLPMMLRLLDSVIQKTTMKLNFINDNGRTKQ
jgi:predicted RND superfamily exporter protein